MKNNYQWQLPPENIRYDNDRLRNDMDIREFWRMKADREEARREAWRWNAAVNCFAIVFMVVGFVLAVWYM